MNFKNILITDAIFEAVTSQQAADQLREDIGNASLWSLKLPAARQAVEQDLICVKLTQAVYELQMNSWFTDDFGSPVIITQYPNAYGYITFPACPLVNIVSVKYDDNLGVEQTLSTSAYTVDTASMPGRLRWTGNITLPGLSVKENAVRIRYTAGYGAVAAADGGQSAVPYPLKEAVLMRLADLYENRQNGMVINGRWEQNPTYWSLVSPWRIPC